MKCDDEWSARRLMAGGSVRAACAVRVCVGAVAVGAAVIADAALLRG